GGDAALRTALALPDDCCRARPGPSVGVRGRWVAGNPDMEELRAVQRLEGWSQGEVLVDTLRSFVTRLDGARLVRAETAGHHAWSRRLPLSAQHDGNRAENQRHKSRQYESL